MAYSKNSTEAFTGGSGQMAVMGELLHHQCNAAIPLVDVGTDVFAFRDDREEVARIQVKTATGTQYKRSDGYSADFRVPIDQLSRADNPKLFYALAVRLTDGWGGIIVISRSKLKELRDEGCGSVIKNKKTKKLALKLLIQFRHEQAERKRDLTAICGNTDLTAFINAWTTLPPMKPPVPIDPPAG